LNPTNAMTQAPTQNPGPIPTLSPTPEVTHVYNVGAIQNALSPANVYKAHTIMNVGYMQQNSVMAPVIVVDKEKLYVSTIFSPQNEIGGYATLICTTYTELLVLALKNEKHWMCSVTNSANGMYKVTIWQNAVLATVYTPSVTNIPTGAPTYMPSFGSTVPQNTPSPTMTQSTRAPTVSYRTEDFERIFSKTRVDDLLSAIGAYQLGYTSIIPPNVRMNYDSVVISSSVTLNSAFSPASNYKQVVCNIFFELMSELEPQMWSCEVVPEVRRSFTRLDVTISRRAWLSTSFVSKQWTVAMYICVLMFAVFSLILLYLCKLDLTPKVASHMRKQGYNII
jgi:hypothetical protein